MFDSPVRRTIQLGRSSLLAALAASVVLLPLLGHKPLTDWDEGIYAEVSREMLTRGWLVPHWNTQPWLEKPPLMLWITAGFFRVFGASEFWARAESALSGVATITVAHAWLFRRRGPLAAWLSTLILLATFGFLHVARVGEMDVLLSLGCLVAVLGLERVTAAAASGWYVFWTGFAIAAMTKGAASIVIPLTALALLLTDRGLLRFPRQFTAGLGIFLLAVAPWHLAMLHRFGRSFLDEYFGLHILARATEQIEGHASHWWYYAKVLLVSAPPFCLLYPFAFARGLRDRQLRFFALFAAVVLVFFSAVQTRLPHYIAPIYPALSILTAVLLADAFEQLRARSAGRTCVAFAGAVLLVSAGSILLTARGRRSLHSATLANGVTFASNKEATALLRRNQPALDDIPGPLLVWRLNQPPLVVDVFYSRRRVQQVELGPPSAALTRDRYLYDPVPLTAAVGPQPTPILLDTALLPTLPAGLVFTSLDRDGPVALGWVARRAPSAPGHE